LIVLDEVVRCPVLHALHGALFADGAGDKDEREVGTTLADHLEDHRPLERRQHVVRDQKIRIELFQFTDQVFPGFHALGDEPDPRGPQLPLFQVEVHGRVLDEEDLDVSSHRPREESRRSIPSDGIP
jgi:hypothetical protein